MERSKEEVHAKYHTWFSSRTALITTLFACLSLYFYMRDMIPLGEGDFITSQIFSGILTFDRRRLGGIKFLTDLSAHLQQPKDSSKPLEFLDPQHLEANKGATVTTARVVPTKPQSETKLEFLDIAKSVNSTSHLRTQENSYRDKRRKEPLSHTIHFMTDGEVLAARKVKQNAIPAVKLKSSVTVTTAKNISNVSSIAKAKAIKEKKDEWLNIHKYDAILHHPQISPRNGSDIISPANQVNLLLCPTQAKCIEPALQLEKKLKVYLCKHPTRHGVRFYYLAREGLRMHPNVDLVAEEDIKQADFIVYLPGSAPWHLTECTNASYASRLIVLDEFDGHSLISPTIQPEEYVKRYGGRNKPWYFMYFKRSFVKRMDGKFIKYPHFIQPDVYPMVYGIADAYIPSHFNTNREIEILCTLRGHKQMSTRLRVQTWVTEYGIERNIKNIIAGQINTATRTTVSMEYFKNMFNAQIIVTVNPANWEGDFRLWESLCTGALIFVDPLYVPYAHPLIGGEHVVYFDNNNRTDLITKLDYYRAHPQEARRIAINGYLHAMKYHRTVSITDYIMRSAHLKQTMQRNARIQGGVQGGLGVSLPPPPAAAAAAARGSVSSPASSLLYQPNYLYTAQYLNYEAALQEPMMLRCDKPGNFSQERTSLTTSRVIQRVHCEEERPPTAVPVQEKLSIESGSGSTNNVATGSNTAAASGAIGSGIVGGPAKVAAATSTMAAGAGAGAGTVEDLDAPVPPAPPASA